MHPWTNILLAVDLSKDSRQVCERAAAVAGLCNARVTLLHVIEYYPMEPMGEALAPSVSIDQAMIDNATERLEKLAQENGLGNAVQQLRTGTTKAEIVAAAVECNADLIVLGAHERHGLAMLINHTGDTMLHAAPCDVLAVRLRH